MTSNNGWPTVPLGKLLTRNDQVVTIDPANEYKEVTIRLWGKGVVLRRIAAGSEIAAERRLLVRANHFILSRIDARNGAMGLVPEELNGAVVSNDFPSYETDSSATLPEFLGWLSKTRGFVDSCRAASEGTTNRVRLQESKFLKLEIPLPPLSEQRRIVAKIERLAAKIDEAHGLQGASGLGADAFLDSHRDSALCGEATRKWRDLHPSLHKYAATLANVGAHKWPDHVKPRKRKPFSLPEPPRVPESWLVVTLGELQESGAILDIQDGNHGSEYPRKAEFSNEGIRFVTAIQMNGNSVAVESAPCLPVDRARRLRIGFARPGDVLLSHNASVGKVARAPLDVSDFLIGTSVTYYRCNPEGINPNYLTLFFRSGLFQQQLRWIMKQTTRNQVSVLKQVNLWICVPPLEEQDAIVAYLDGLQAKVDELKRLQADSAAELDALLPAILDRAFKGQL